MKRFAGLLLTFSCGLGLSLPGLAATIPFTEGFDASGSGWRDASNGITSLTHETSGGQDGGGHVATSISFLDFTFGDQGPVLFRAPGSASGGAFVGDWITESVGELRFWVRHDLPVPLNFFARFASPFNFPGATAVEFAPVLGTPVGGWTEVVVSIDPANPSFVSFEGTDFETVFSNIGIVQIGVSVPEGLAGVDATVQVDLDTVGIVAPEPASALLLVPALLLATRRRS